MEVGCETMSVENMFSFAFVGYPVFVRAKGFATVDCLGRGDTTGEIFWRPVPGVRSTSEVYMHIAMANFYLLSVTGPKMPADLKEGMEKTITSKTDVIAWLKRSLEAVKTAHLAEKSDDLQRRVHIVDRDATVEGIYLRIIVHANEHMGQLVAYARLAGVVPPWAKE
jgi:uncharacterized damage-inducible protein DinB